MAYPYGNHQEQQQRMHVVSSFNRDSATESAFHHNPGISLDWTLEEQTLFQEGLIQFASVPCIVRRYNLIANQLPNKNVREVMLRDKWMNFQRKPNSISIQKKENGKTRKSKDKKEKVFHPAAKSSAFAARPNVSPYAPAILIDNDNGISSKAIGGPTGELLEQNARALKQISANIAACKVGNADKLDASEALIKYQNSIKLFCQTRDNIYKILNDLNNDFPEATKQMPPFNVHINEELAMHLPVGKCSP